MKNLVALLSAALLCVPLACTPGPSARTGAVTPPASEAPPSAEPVVLREDVTLKLTGL